MENKLKMMRAVIREDNGRPSSRNIKLSYCGPKVVDASVLERLMVDHLTDRTYEQGKWNIGNKEFVVQIASELGPLWNNLESKVDYVIEFDGSDFVITDGPKRHEELYQAHLEELKKERTKKQKEAFDKLSAEDKARVMMLTMKGELK